jgi:geranylgeranyl reductase family protein
MQQRVFDAVVSGAGPVGSMAAYRLASAGASVALLDKATFPREKPCGGGLQARLVRHIPFSVEPVVRSTLSGVTFSHGLTDRFTRHSAEPLVYGVRRREFDQFLFEQAAAAGATAFPGTAVRTFEDEGPAAPVVVRTDRGIVRGRILIGADGMNGIVRRRLNAESAFFRQAALYCEIPRDLIRGDWNADHELRIDWGTLPTGYGWMFPKGETINVGVGAPTVFGRKLRGYFAEVVERERLLRPDVSISSLAVRGYTLATMTDATRLARGRVLLAGDAGGLIEAFTGDGLSHGVHSAQIAADHVMRWLGGERGALEAYPSAIERDVRPALIEGRILMAFFNTFVGAIHRLFGRDERAWEDLCAILAGRAGFDHFHRRRLGPLLGLKPWLDRFSFACERYRLLDEPAPLPAWLGVPRALLGAAIARL